MPNAADTTTGPARSPLVLAWVLVQSLVVAGLQLGRTGYVLLNDSVAVPQQTLLPWMWGAGSAPPRSVPQDAIVAVVDNVLPGWVLQRVLVVGALMLLGLGTARLLSTRPAFEQAGAATFAIWSTFVFERSLMGHWGLLLGLGALPWVLRAAAELREGTPGSLPRLVGWVVVGSLVPTAGLLLVTAAALVLLRPPVRARRALAGVLATVTVQLVWVVPGLLTHTGTSASPPVFGLRGEGPAGALLTALGTGGIWNSAVMPPSRAGAMALIAPIVLVVLGALGAARAGGAARAVLGPLAVLSLGGLCWGVLTSLPVAEPAVSAVESLPGGGLLRDAQKWLAPWVVLLAICSGAGLGRIRDRMARSGASRYATVLLLLLPVVLLPDLAFGAGGRLSPATYPPEWGQVRSALAASPHPGDVVSLPWSTFRAYPWNGDRTVLDPASRFLPRTVVSDSRLLVAQGDDLAVVPSDDPRSTEVEAALLSRNPARELRELGIGWVLWQRGQPGTPGHSAQLPAWLATAGARVVGEDSLVLVELSGPVSSLEERPHPALPIVWMAWGFLLVVACAGVLSYWVRSRPRPVSPAARGSAMFRNGE